MKYAVLSFLTLLLLITSTAKAGEVMASLGTNVNFQLSSNGRTYEAVAPLSVRGGYRFSFADLFLEFSESRRSSGAGTVSVANSNQEFLLWLRRSDPTAQVLRAFVGAGAGVHRSVIDTKVATLNSNDGSVEPMGALAAGVEFRFIRLVSLSIEGRATFARDYAPNPLFGLGGFLSFSF